MTENKHAPEPWEVQPRHGNCRQILSANYEDVAWLGEFENDANAKRVVACVNAFAGVPTEVIEAGFVRKLCESWRSAYEHSGTPENDFEKAVLLASGKGNK